jgi:hypothetical protein
VRGAEVGGGAVEGSCVDHHGGAVGKDEEGGVAAVGGELVDLKVAGGPGGKDWRGRRVAGECVSNGV